MTGPDIGWSHVPSVSTLWLYATDDMQYLKRV